jgi:selenocysteine lyase/cysteine desulfurase
MSTFSETANRFLSIAAWGRYLETMYNRSSIAHKDHVGMRISLAFFNTISEVETLLDALATELSAFAPMQVRR